MGDYQIHTELQEAIDINIIHFTKHTQIVPSSFHIPVNEHYKRLASADTYNKKYSNQPEKNKDPPTVTYSAVY